MQTLWSLNYLRGFYAYRADLNQIMPARFSNSGATAFPFASKEDAEEYCRATTGPGMKSSYTVVELKFDSISN